MPEIIKEKKKILIGGLVALLVFGVIGIFFFLKKVKEDVISPLSQVRQKEKQPELLLWDDEAGFTFKYPQELYIDDHPEDMENYAHLEITAPKEPGGKILILVKDTQIKTIEEWVNQEKEATTASVLDTTLADIPAKKLLFNEPKKVLTAAIDSYEGLFLLELSPGEGEFWPKVYDQILKSFAFKPLTKEEQEVLQEVGGEESSGDVVYEEEEVIE